MSGWAQSQNGHTRRVSGLEDRSTNYPVSTTDNKNKTKQNKTEPPCVGQYPKCLTFLLSKFWCNLKNCSNNDQKLPKFGKRHELSDSRSLTNPKQDKQKEIHA